MSGIVLGQAILFGPSLVGSRILLPLGYLSEPGVYLPATPEFQHVTSHNRALSDQVLAFQLSRHYASMEIRSGRVPLWSHYNFAGAPFVKFAKYSPFNLVYTLFPTPVSLAWIQLIKSLVAGIGAYLYFKRVLRVGFWPATAGGWCYPISGFLMLWLGFEISFNVVWLPWLLLCVDELARRPEGYRGAGVALVTCLVVISGQLDVAALVLIASALYAIIRLATTYRGRFISRPALRAAAALALAWSIGIALSAPFVLPLVEYAQAGDRMQRRVDGAEERPPLGISAMIEAVLPNAHGSLQENYFQLRDGNRLEAASPAYAGLLATLVLAPLAWCSKRHRSIGLCWLFLGAVGIGWIANLPGMVPLMRLPALNLLSYNRFVFLTGFAILVLAVIGLEVLRQDMPQRRRWFWACAAVPLALCLWSFFSLVWPPEPVAELALIVQQGVPVDGPVSLKRALEAHRTFVRTYWLGALLCALAVGSWCAIWFSGGRRRWLPPALVAVTIAELLWFAHDINPQTDPALYYPRIPVLTALSDAGPGRILCIGCLPANLNQAHGLRDIRGYDGVDPARLMSLMRLAAAGGYREYRYAATQWYEPAGGLSIPDIVKLPEILNLLGVRYIVVRGAPLPGFEPLLAGEDYWVAENSDALPRVFVPRSVEHVADSDERLRRMQDPAFDARATAFLEGPLRPVRAGVGTVEIVSELPNRLSIAADMERGGLVVLADLWDRGWMARADGQPVPIHRTNHALRGVVAPDGHSVIEFEYAPASFTWGLWIMLIALIVLAVWTALRVRARSER